MSNNAMVASRETTNRVIEPERLGYTRLYLDQIAGRSPAIDYFPTRTLAEAADRLQEVSFDRQVLQDILRRQNKIYGASDATFASINRLGDKASMCVFAGQQAGLFGGPLLTLTKALALVKASRQYSEELGRSVVPVFWIAGDDHDFEEANHTFVLKRSGDICRNVYQTPPDKPWPLSDVVFSDVEELARLKNQIKSCLGETDFTGDLFGLIDSSYTPDDTFVSAFGKFVSGLTKGTGLVLFNPCDDDAKRLAAPLLKQVVERQDEILEAFNARTGEIEAAGYHVQVEKSDNASHLFYHEDGRQPILRDGDHFTVGEHTWSKQELLERIEAEPQKFSPDVIIRPVMQSYLFPVVSQKGGPAEIAYLAQLNPLFEMFDLVPPLHKARPTFTVVETRFEKLLKEYHIEFHELTGDIEQVINRVLGETFPPNLEVDFNSLRDTIKRQFEKIRAEALDFDNQLKKYSQQVEGKLDYTLKQFEGKVWSSHKKHHQDTRERIYRLYNALYTNGGLQERSLNITYFAARYGIDFVGYLLDRVDCEETRHQLISLSEYHV